MYICDGAVKLEKAIPEGLEVIPYGIMVLLGSTNKPPPTKFRECWLYRIVSCGRVPVMFAHVYTGEFPGSPAAYVPGVFIAATKLGTHFSYV